jgi:hypothetical protein
MLLARHITFGAAMLALWQASGTTTIYFPQVADGGAFSTTIFVANPAGSEMQANVIITFKSSGGDPLDITFVDNLGQQFNGSVNLQIQGGGSRRLVSTATSESVQVGFATLTSDIPVAGRAVFSQFSGPPQSSELLSEASINASAALTSQAFSSIRRPRSRQPWLSPIRPRPTRRTLVSAS